MNTLQDPGRKTSINSLLNPALDVSSYPQPPYHGPGAASNDHASSQYGPAFSNGGQYNLRAANWESGDQAPNVNLNGVARSKESAETAVTTPHHQRSGSYHFSPAATPATTTSASLMSPNGTGDANGYGSRTPRPHADHSPTRGAQWHTPAASQSPSSYPATTSQASPMYPDSRHAMPQQPSDSVHETQSMADYNNQSQFPASEFQSSERVSLRLAARESIPATQPASYTQHTTNYYGPMPHDYSNPPYAHIASNNASHPSHQGGDRAQSPSSLQSQQPQPAKTSAKRRLPQSEAEATAPKPKRPAKSKAKTTSDGVPGPSKRGFNTKKRAEAAQIAAKIAQYFHPQTTSPVGGSELGMVDSCVGPATQLVPELQFARCMSNRYKNEDFPRCVSCTRRWAGDTCRFQGIRYFLKDQAQNLVGVCYGETAAAPNLHFPVKWNVPLRKDHIVRSKRVLANALLPTLKQEREHLNSPELIRRTRESEVRVTCDTCMTSIFSSSWMCRQCGREACHDCFELIKDLTQERPGATPAERAEMQRRREKHAHGNPFFLACTRRNEHEAKFFSPMSRFEKGELEQAIADMEKLLLEDPPTTPISSVTDGHAVYGDANVPPAPVRLKDGAAGSPAAPANPSVPAQKTETRPWSEVYRSNQIQSSFLPPELAPSGSAPRQFIPPNLTESTAKIPTIEPYRFTDGEVTNSDSMTRFARIWEHGEPVVVANILDKFRLEWTPEYFSREFGDRECLITECELDVNKKTTVREFFSSFGNYEGRTEVWKLKDWPPSSDFKTAFPKLYEDFANAVPVPDYVRRDGVLNMGSHFPSNVVAPDLGPKMYNAWVAKQAPGTKGSTRLHMDMADAMNVMLYAAPCPDGSPGCAVWDIYRACDSDKIRAFLKAALSLAPNYDPIHGQQYYMDDTLRMRLFEEYGVKSYRVYQRPGEAVFIPAGCAHQVANMADSIKIAIDYVSPENIDRCARLTREFREQNKSKVWKEDVLQLKSLMWFAWQSCCDREARLSPTGSSSASGSSPMRSSASPPASVTTTGTSVTSGVA